MSEPAPAPRDHATDEAIAAAIARAERRLWLLEMMIAFAMELLRALNPGGAAGALLARAATKALVAISRAVRLAISIAGETRRLLRGLRAGILPAPEARRAAARPRAAETASAEGAETSDGQVGESIERECDKAFRARLEDLEALLDRKSDWTAGETVLHLCHVMGVDPEWSRWLGDDWLEDNLNLTRPPSLSPPGGSAAPRDRPRVGQRINSAGEGGPPRAPALLASVSRPALIYWPPPPRSLSSG